MANLPEITDKNFESEVLKSSVPFLLDFSASWCGPCKIVGPIVEEIAKEQAGKLKIGMLDIDKNPKIPAQFTIMSVPTLLLFKGGELKEQIVGALPKKAILQRIAKHL
jgi:thioredoxin 1